MPGGPINGAPWSAMAGLLPGGAAIASAARRGADADKPENYTGIIIPTVLQMAADILSYWKNLTCLYDKYWVPDPDKVTLPICMFNVAKITPMYSVESSKKRVILYEPQGDKNMKAEEMAGRLRENVIRAVVDNSVKQPTTYNMDIIVPFQPVGRYVSDGVKIFTDAVSGFFDLLDIPSAVNAFEGLFSSALAYMKTAGAAAEFAGKLPDMDGVSYINMNSLEAMAESCRTLCMKMWTGQDYKFVQITNMTSDKKGSEDDVFRASLTLQEKPVLAVSRPRDDTAKRDIKRNWKVKKVGGAQGALVTPLIALTRVRGENAAGGGKFDKGVIEEMLGG